MYVFWQVNMQISLKAKKQKYCLLSSNPQQRKIIFQQFVLIPEAEPRHGEGGEHDEEGCQAKVPNKVTIKLRKGI